jgi:transcriptional activator SPT7
VSDIGISQKSYGGKTVKNQEGDDNVDLEQEDKKLGDEIDADMGELQDQIWRDKTKKTRAKFTVNTTNNCI